MATIGSGLISINKTWTQLKMIAVAKQLSIQYDDTSTAYDIFTVDGLIAYYTVIFRGSVPNSNYDQTQNDSDKSDFETNYKDIVTNKPAFPSAAIDGYLITTANPTLIAGSDGTNIRNIKADSSGRLITVGAGTAGSPIGGVLTIQGVTSGTAVTIKGSDSDNTTNSTTKLPVIAALSNTSAPSWTDNMMVPLSVDTSGSLRSTSSQSGTWTVQPGNTANTTPWLVTINQGSNSAVVKAASTAAVAADPALVVAISPNNTIGVITNDATASGTLGALDAYVQVALTGLQGAGFQFAANNLVGTIIPEISYNNGNTWNITFFDDPTTDTKVSSIVVSSSTIARSIIIGAGASHARVKVSAYTSGSVSCSLRASNVRDPSTLYSTPVAGVAAPSVAYIGGAVATTPPTYTTSTSNVVSLSTFGGVRIEPRLMNITTYSATAINFVAANSATDIFTITGSASKTIRILKLIIAGTRTTATQTDFIFLKRSTANTAGTSATPTIVPYDSANAAATAVVRNYTANPSSLGTLVGNLFSTKIFISTTTTIGGNATIFDMEQMCGQTIVLRGTGELFAINLNSITVTGNSLIISIFWTEE